MTALGNRCLLFLYVISIVALLAPSDAWTEDPAKEEGKSPGQSIVIRSDAIEIDHQKKTVVFSGNVDAKREDLVIACQKMVLYYVELPTHQAGDKAELRIDRIIASGGVKITRPDGGSAAAEQATYYQDSEKVVLTGKPRVSQGQDSVEGSVITLFLRENRSTVEGLGDQRVRAIIAPRESKR